MHGNIQRHKIRLMYYRHLFERLIGYACCPLSFSFEFEMLQICELVKVAEMET